MNAENTPPEESRAVTRRSIFPRLGESADRGVTPDEGDVTVDRPLDIPRLSSQDFRLPEENKVEAPARAYRCKTRSRHAASPEEAAARVVASKRAPELEQVPELERAQEFAPAAQAEPAPEPELAPKPSPAPEPAIPGDPLIGTLSGHLAKADEGFYSERYAPYLRNSKGANPPVDKANSLSESVINVPPSYQPKTSPASFEDEFDEEPEPPRQPWVRTVVEIVAIIVSVLLISVVVKTFLVQAFSVPSRSMESTLEPGDKFFVNRLITSEDEIRRGDVVVFVDPGGWLTPAETDENPVAKIGRTVLQGVGILPADTGHFLVKRVIGKSGDHVQCCTDQGKITVNGTPIDERYLDPGMAPSMEEFDVIVPRGQLWMMGDNRSNSKDSRWHQRETGNGFVPVGNVAGRAFVIFHPWDRAGKLTDYSDVFAEVAEPQGAAAGG